MERTVQLDDVDPRVLYGEQNALMRQLESYYPKLSIVDPPKTLLFLKKSSTCCFGTYASLTY